MPSVFRYFFPPRQLREKVEPLPGAISSNVRRLNDTPNNDFSVRMLMGYGLARTRSDALRILQKHQGRSLERIIELERPRRRFWGRFRRAWKRLQAIW